MFTFTKEVLNGKLNFVQCWFQKTITYCVKNVHILSFSGTFPAFGLLRIQSECGKIWTRRIPNTHTFHTVNDFYSSPEANFRELRNFNKEHVSKQERLRYERCCFILSVAIALVRRYFKLERSW